MRRWLTPFCPTHVRTRTVLAAHSFTREHPSDLIRLHHIICVSPCLVSSRACCVSKRNICVASEANANWSWCRRWSFVVSMVGDVFTVCILHCCLAPVSIPLLFVITALSLYTESAIAAAISALCKVPLLFLSVAYVLHSNRILLADFTNLLSLLAMLIAELFMPADGECTQRRSKRSHRYMMIHLMNTSMSYRQQSALEQLRTHN